MTDFYSELSRRIVGQPKAMDAIVPYILMHQAGLAPEGRPIGVFLLLGPTGTGKTRTVEAVSEVLHGTAKNVLRIDCGEFQLDHEVAKLIGAPPGYLGHRETHPMLSQAKLTSAASENSDVAVVLFDEIEKAAPSMTRLMLGILDRATLRLGDNNNVNFQNTLIFLTSNLGAEAMQKELAPAYGLGVALEPGADALENKVEAAANAAVRKHFLPEFVNRIDATVVYRPLDSESLRAILDHQIGDLQRHIVLRLGSKAFLLDVSNDGRKFLLERGTSARFGAREIKRAIHKHLTQELAALLAEGKIPPGSRVVAKAPKQGDVLDFRLAA